jgi:hypothetical protein
MICDAKHWTYLTTYTTPIGKGNVLLRRFKVFHRRFHPHPGKETIGILKLQIPELGTKLITDVDSEAGNRCSL